MNENQTSKRMKRIFLFTISWGLFIAVFFLMRENLLIPLVTEYESIFITGSVQKEQVLQTANRPGENLQQGMQYGVIQCNQKALYAPLYYGDSEEILEKGAGTYMGYALPGEGKTILSGAHDSTYYGALEQIEPGDMIEINTYWGNYQYQVKKCKVAEVSEEDAYAQEDGELLILYTCYPVGKDSQQRTKRLYVYAERIETADES